MMEKKRSQIVTSKGPQLIEKDKEEDALNKSIDDAKM